MNELGTMSAIGSADCSVIADNEIAFWVCELWKWQAKCWGDRKYSGVNARENCSKLCTKYSYKQFSNILNRKIGLQSEMSTENDNVITKELR